MGSGISKLFSIEKEEKSIIGILLFQSVFLGVFYGVFNITAHAIFLSRFDETDMARAYIISGLAGSGLTYLYSLFQARFRFSAFSVFNLLFIFLVTVCLWVLIRTTPEAWVVYAIFVMLGPLFILAMLSYWGTAGRLFTLRQGRRFFGIIDTGLIVGMILSSFSIPALLSFGIQTHNILLISAVSILASVVVQLLINKRHKAMLSDRRHSDQSKAGLKVFRENSYIRAMGIFIALSVLVVFFVQYSFMAVTKIRYPEEGEMARFLGFFEGTMMVFTLLIKTFIFSYLIKNQGLKVTLAISPVLMGLFAIVAVIIGTTRGFVAGSSGFMIFFLVLAITRLFSKALKDSVESPAFKVLYQTLGEKFRHSVQSTIDGTVNEVAALTAGLVLTGLGALTFIKLIHFSWALSIIIILWVIYALRLYSEYRSSIRKTLEATVSASSGEEKESENEVFNSVSSSGLFIDNNYFEIITGTDIHNDIAASSLLMEQLINKAEKSLNPDILPLLRRINSVGIGNNGPGIRLASVIGNIETNIEKQGLGGGKNLLSTIEESSNRKMHLQTLMSGSDVPVITDLMRLIRDQDNDIKRETIFIVGKFRIKELLPEICECLDNEVIASDAYSVLKRFGEEACPALAGHYFRSSGNIAVRRLLLRLFSETGGSQAIDFLLPGIWSINRLIRKEAVTGLVNCGYRADEDTRNRLLQEVQDIIGLLTWNLSAQISLRENNNHLLCDTLEKETQWWSGFLFDLLSLIYDKSSLDKIKENLDSGTVESVNFALEMLDIVVDDELKPRLTAFLDVVSVEEKVKNLFQFYPGNIPEYNTLVQELVNKDYNHIGIWTKACALRSLYDLPKPDETDFLVALLFGVHRILREEACRYLQDNYDDVYSSCSYRLPKVYREQLELVLKEKKDERELLYNKLLSLSMIFTEIPENSLPQLAEKIRIIENGNDLRPYAGSDYIIWPVHKEAGQEEVKLSFNWHTPGLKFDAGKIEEAEGVYYLLEIEEIEKLVFYEPDNYPLLVKCMDNNIIEDEQ
ncbi:MAG: hypothetical protein U5K32_09175 [Bacteroidales bacterium]|nr:hypothetical protein [Bacteroidales bacterium]